MSAIAKPFVHFTSSQTPSVYVPVEHVNTVDKLDIPAVPNQPSSTAKYLILVTSVYPSGETKKIEIPFTTSAARDTSLVNFKAAMSTAIA